MLHQMKHFAPLINLIQESKPATSLRNVTTYFKRQSQIAWQIQ